MPDLLHVDLTRRSATKGPLTVDHEMLGGHALTSAIVAEEVDPKADPLGPGNVLVFAAGLYAGTMVPNGGRLSVGAKSPLTGGIKEANSGGSTARTMSKLDLRGIKLTGRADALSIVEIDAAGARVVPAGDSRGAGPTRPSPACARSTAIRCRSSASAQRASWASRPRRSSPPPPTSICALRLAAVLAP